jgi:glycosyltransferase involved in cell wall biosynthesis
MQVLFDEQVFLLQKRGGISRYFTELIRCFIQYAELQVEPVLNFKHTSNENLLALSDELELGICRISAPRPLQVVRSITKNAIRIPKVDLIHHTFYSKTFWHSPFVGPRVTTHHDMIPEMFPGNRFFINPHLSKSWYYRNVDHIFSVSDSAKQDLIRFWPDVHTPISITHLGKPDMPKQKFEREQGYVIYVGARQGYKDAETLIRAFAQLPEYLKFKLEFLGGDEFSQVERDLIGSLNISKYVSQRNVTDLELFESYCKAHLFVFPSRYEGFGLPALEALQLGCRSVLSNTPALLEVARSCADYFTPGNVCELKNVLLSALSEGVEENPHLESGIIRANDFSWHLAAKDTAKVYHSLI